MKSIILAGGNGTRLWPESRRSYPKQFLSLTGKRTFLQSTLMRNFKIVDSSDSLVITNMKHSEVVRKQAQDINKENIHIISEPIGRNTAPAIALGIKYLIEKMGAVQEEIIFVSPSDHLITPVEKYVKAIKDAEILCQNGYIVTFGIKPSRPDTGYGYIKEGTKIEKIKTEGFKVEKFVEKPNLKTAINYLESGEYSWNSGMFAFSINGMLEEFKKYLPDIYKRIMEYNYDRFINEFKDMESISIDYGIMEKSSNIAVLPLELEWSDVGSWDSVYDIGSKDSDGNVKSGEVITIESRNSLIRSNGRLITTIGIDDLIIVEKEDSLFIARRGDSQRVKDIVEKLDEKLK